MKTRILIALLGHGLAAVAFGQPVITIQPQSQTNVVGSRVTLSVEATGTPPLFYQWRRGGGDVTGRTNATLVFTNLQTSDAGNYTFVVTNVEGSVTSMIAYVRVLVPPAIAQTGQPTNFPVLSLGASVSNRVVASGTAPLNYQWRRDGANLAARTNATLVLTNLQLADAGDYTAVVTNVAGSITSQVARLDVDPTFTKITTGRIVNDGGYSYDCAWGDYDNDGFIDLFVENDGAPGGHPNFLYRNDGNGTFTRITASQTGSIITDVATCHGTAWGDYDNDGLLDLFVTVDGGNNFLYRNNGNGTFFKITNASPVATIAHCHAPNWGDYDNDGFLDLFVAHHDNEGNALYQNNGDGTFRAITNGPVFTDRPASWGCASADYDNDGRLDLFVAADGGNELYRNSGSGNFVKITNSPIVTAVFDDNWWARGGAWGDYDNDGNLDLFVTNSRRSGTADPGQNNSLFHNNGDGSFTRITEGSIVNDGGVSICAAWGDYDNDGFLDLFVSNFVIDPNNPSRGGQNNFLYRNNGNGTFSKITTGSLVNDGGSSAGCAWGDYDNDGFLDLFVGNGGFVQNENNFLYHNNGNSNSWITFKLIGTASNRSAIGAKVRINATIGGRVLRQLREISGGSGFGSQNDLRPHFGLGDATNIDLVRIEWSSGTVQELRNVAVKQFLTVTEPPRLQGRMSDGQFQTTLTAWNGQRFAVERSSNLMDWSPFAAVTHTNRTMVVIDLPDAPQRFYRVRPE